MITRTDVLITHALRDQVLPAMNAWARDIDLSPSDLEAVALTDGGDGLALTCRLANGHSKHFPFSLPQVH